MVAGLLYLLFNKALFNGVSLFSPKKRSKTSVTIAKSEKHSNLPTETEQSIMYDIRFWKAAGERAAKTAAQAAILAILGSGMAGMADASVNAFTIDWLMVLGFAVGGAVLSVLTSVVSAPLGKNPGPSLADETLEPDPVVVEVAPAAPAKATARKKS